MSDKAKWAGIYLLVCFIPLLFYFHWPLSEEIISNKAITDFLKYAPYVGLFLVAILGWKINQTRVFWSTLFLLAFYHYLLHHDFFTITETGRAHTLQMVSVAYPLALCVIYSFRESRIWSDLSLARILLALSPLLLIICLFSWAPDVYQQLFFWGPETPGQVATLPRLAWVALALFLLLVIYLNDPKIKSFLIALWVTLLPFFFCVQANLINFQAVNKIPFLSRDIIAFVTMTVILLFALLRMFWQKVYLDPLTSVSNRQALDERLNNLHGDFSLAMVDIDHFKKFNDNHGHAEGDNVLRMVAQHLEEHLGDHVYRYGGEEFCAVFEKLSHEKAVEMMEKVRATLEKRRFTLRGQRKTGYNGLKLPFQKDEHRGKRVHITISVGVASVSKNHRTSEEVIKRADHALYEAKEKGRNRVMSADK